MNDQDINHTTSINPDDSVEYKLEEITNFAKNKVISTDGLTLVEVFQALVQMLNGDLELAKKVLAHANIMAKYGMKVAKESQLSRADVLQFLIDKENVVSKQDSIRKLSPTPAVKPIKKKIRGFLDG
ncbi:hypothetical protein [Wolbachia endosymbiont of Dirofilaria (Dirofilaria) immitis]|uniref:hypothetical protein n=1 Tax=Wolbachia endosymbiont of Dirofilaria (Dirofilaria) immitis TaxID=1812115 RepID=UPI00158900B2|nr:hypothetical protein [Wolbachia endosymbiont of Dirofilaria (Dirofilaria) immitis]QKX02110.1 hypothetical protein GOY12_00720 [Wolbachia endosymbiont of Dirofilaria (Dirofilaria) immitis]